MARLLLIYKQATPFYLILELMTPSDPITDLVLAFLDANVDSIQQLEILRILGEDPERQWQANDLANAAQTKLSSLPGELSSLESRGLVKVELAGAELTCRYAPKSTEIAELLAKLLQVYNARPVTLIKRVYSRALNAFAESFRIRKES